jgi:hypothetical protein
MVSITGRGTVFWGTGKFSRSEVLVESTAQESLRLAENFALNLCLESEASLVTDFRSVNADSLPVRAKEAP